MRVRGDVSSQFLTALLLMTLPLVAREQAVVIEVEGELISKALHRHHLGLAGALWGAGGSAKQLVAVLSIPAGSRLAFTPGHLVRGRGRFGRFLLRRALGAIGATSGADSY